LSFCLLHLMLEVLFHRTWNKVHFLVLYCRGAPSQSLSGTLSGAIGNLTNLRQV
jgi:hypothetical protein